MKLESEFRLIGSESSLLTPVKDYKYVDHTGEELCYRIKMICIIMHEKV